jgi:adenylate cyclase
MPDTAEPAICRFNDFLLCKQAGTLFRLHPDGRRSPVQIGSRAFQMLCLLVDRRGEVVSRREIMDAVWPKVAVEQNNLTVQLTALRRVLDADRGQGSCIENITGRGYRFVPTVTEEWPPLLDQVDETLPEHDHQRAGHGETSDASDTGPRPANSHAAAESTLATIVLPSGTRTSRSQTARIAAACLCIAALLASAGWYVNRAPLPQAENTAAPVPVTSVERPRLSLVVLPFINLGGESVGDATVDAITEDLTNDLSRAWGLFVIGRSSAFTYKGKPVDIRRLGEELGVRYAVEGSVRKIEGTLRVNAQLLSTDTGAQIWADYFGVERDGLSYTVDDIVRQIAAAMHAGVVENESARGTRERPANPDLTDLLLRARWLNNLPQNPQRDAQKIDLLERAVELDPFSATALAGLAEALLDSGSGPISDDPTASDKLRRAEDLVRRAEQLRPNDMLVMFTKVYLLGKQFRCSEVVPAAQRAISAYPNINSTHYWLGICFMFDGRAAEAIPEIEQSIRLNPRNSYVWNRYRLIGYCLLFLNRYQEAILWLRRSIAAVPNDNARRTGVALAAIAAAQALAGQIAEARSSAVEAARLWPTITTRSYPYKVTNPFNTEQTSHMRSGLGRAGIRDHADENADSGIASDNVLHSDYEAPTPTSVPGAQTIKTAELNALIEQRKPLLLDVSLPWGPSIPGAVGLWGAGIGGSTSDQFQDRLGRKMVQLTNRDHSVPVVTVGWNAERFQGRNLALRLVALGYTEVYWYRGGREAWEVASLPETAVDTQDW